MDKIYFKDLEPSDIIFTYDNGFISEFIRSVSKEDYSHALVYHEENLVLESGWLGVVITGLKNYEKKSIGKTVVRLPLSNAEKKEFRRALLSYVGDNYDWKLFFGHFFKTLFRFISLDLSVHDSRSRWLCYEAVAKGLEKIGFVFDKEAREFTPQTLFEALKKIKGVKVWKLEA